jgi:aquaporin Z
LSQTFLRITDRLSINQKKFIAKVAGTFIVVTLATGSVVIDAKTNGILGIPFIAFAPFIGVAIAVYLFGKISMTVILVVVYTKGLKGLSGIAIGGIVGLDIFFLAFISGASMNPARSLAPAVLSGAMAYLWLYWTATFIGTSAVALLLRKKLRTTRKN